jgi:predicted DCC family thiol-disulfide oxidoreductase YuxK
MMITATTMLYDADCGLCTAAAAWLMRRAREGELQARPLQTATVQGVPDLTQTLHVLTPDGGVLTGSRAVLAAARTVPKWGAVAKLADNTPGHAILDPAYRWVARHRRGIGRALGIKQVCSVPETSPVTRKHPLR